MFVLGINHHTTPIEIREKLAFNTTQLEQALNTLANQFSHGEVAILSTCNRTEIYAHKIDPDELQLWLAKHKKLPDCVELSDFCYQYHETHAIKHIMRVACGLDSMVLGEPQVLGQLKQAYFAAQNAGTIGNQLKLLFPSVFEISKTIRTHTDIGTHPVSMAYAITQLAKKKFCDLESCRVILIGAGETIELIATHLHSAGMKQIIVANRTIEKTQSLIDIVQAHAIQIQDIPTYIKDSDIVISATASQLPIIGKGLIENTMQHRKDKPLLLIDLAVPRDIEPEIQQIDSVFLYNIDDLHQIIASNLKNRSEAAAQAESMIELEANAFLRKMRLFHARHVITAYRDRLDKIRLAEQEKAFRRLSLGQNPQIVLEQFGHHLINKILHHPTIKLREAASEEHCDVFQQIKTFFELE